MSDLLTDPVINSVLLFPEAQSTVIGQGAGTSRTTATDCTLAGFQSGHKLTTGVRATFFGTFAGYGITGAIDVVAIGYAALGQHGVNSPRSVAIGSYALQRDTGGVGLTVAIGAEALTYAYDPEGSVAVGDRAGWCVDGGNAVTYVGYAAGEFNAGGKNSIAIGAFSGGSHANMALAPNDRKFTAHNYTAVGYCAGYSIRTGSDFNTLIGTGAGYRITTGKKNVIIGGDNVSSGGYYAEKETLTTGCHNIKIGYGIQFPNSTAHGQINIGNLIFGAGAIGEGTTVAGRIGIGVEPAAVERLAVDSFRVTDGKLYAANLPTSDPHEAGRVWSNAGTLMVSAA